MKRREFLLESGAAIAAASVGACRKTSRLESNIVSLREQMAAGVARHEFPGAVWLVAQGDAKGNIGYNVTDPSVSSG